MTWKGTAKLLAPGDFPLIEMTAAEAWRRTNYQGQPGRLKGRLPGAWDVPARLRTGPNLSLLFQRYFPARNERPDYEEAVDGSLDLRDIWAQALNNSERRTVAALARAWKGSGALGWFAHVANGQLSQFCGLLAAPFGKAQDRSLHARREAALGRPAHVLEARTTWRATLGLANPSPQENSGWAFDPTYGFPVLPASSLKGLLSHYLREELGLDPTAVGSLGGRKARDALGGAVDDALLARAEGYAGGKASEREAAAKRCTAARLEAWLLGPPADQEGMAVVRLHDGWPVYETGRPWFEVDVLTCHHREYYAGGAQVDGDPNPVHFLTLTRGVRFRVPIDLTARGRRLPEPLGRAAVDLSARFLAEALERWGAGAKTGSGYGRMTIPQGGAP